MKKTLFAFVALLAFPFTAPAATEAETFGRQSIEVLCERSDGDAYLAIFRDEETSAYELSVSGDLYLGETELVVDEDKISVVSEILRDPIVITKGKSRIEISGSEFNCQY